MNPFKNIVVNLQASGPAAVMCVLIICVTVVGIFGNGDLAKQAMTVLNIVVGLLFGSLAFFSKT
jgi:hypothetical protein